MLLGVIGTTAIYLLFAWLISAIVASYLSGRKGYGERIGLAFGLILAPLGALIWLIWPAREGSDWKVIGPWGRPKVEIHEGGKVKEPVPGEGPAPGATS